ncbi:MAG: hypothetical protein AB1371_08570 [Pseudomonadota bacterium]
MRFWLVVLALVAACTGAAARWWERDHAWWKPPAPLRPEVPSVPTLPEPVQASTAAAIERPLLWSTRRPPRARTQEDRLLEELNQSRLIAVVQSGEQRVALLRTPSGGLVKYGNQTRPWRLESFDGRQAVFVTDEGQRAARPLEAARGR